MIAIKARTKIPATAKPMYSLVLSWEEEDLDRESLLEEEELGLEWELGEMDGDWGSEEWFCGGGALIWEEGEGGDGTWGDGGELDCEGGEPSSDDGGGGDDGDDDEDEGGVGGVDDSEGGVGGVDDSEGGVGGGDDSECGGGENFDGGGEECGGGCCALGGGCCAWGGGCCTWGGGGEGDGEGGGGEWGGGAKGGGGDFDGASSGGSDCFVVDDVDGDGAEAFSEFFSKGGDVPFVLFSLAISDCIKYLKLIYSQKWLENRKTKTRKLQWEPTILIF